MSLKSTKYFLTLAAICLSPMISSADQGDTFEPVVNGDVSVQITQPAPTSSVQKALTISEVVNEGQFLILSDNSVWQVKPSFWSVSGGWLMPVEVSIESSPDAEFPYLMKNAFTNESIQVQKSSIEALHAAEQELKVHKEQLTPQKKEEVPVIK